MIKPSEFIHPEDAAALRQLESIPGFPAFVKKAMALGLEQLQYGVNMASAIRLSPNQLPKIYNHLPPICQKLGIDEPEFYLEMNPMPNAWTFGDTRVFITVTSGLVEMLDDEELDAVIAHECGHIICHHVLYHSIAQYILKGANTLGLLGKLAAPVQYAILYWYRKSELSCDRCGSIITSAETVARSMARLSGGPKSLTENINMSEWIGQADRYDRIRTAGAWDKTLQSFATMGLSHPFSAVRVREILEWGQSPQYKALMENLKAESSGKRCHKCNRAVIEDWAYCKYCGAKL